jgi:hypothetical protein
MGVSDGSVVVTHLREKTGAPTGEDKEVMRIRCVRKRAFLEP